MGHHHVPGCRGTPGRASQSVVPLVLEGGLVGLQLCPNPSHGGLAVGVPGVVCVCVVSDGDWVEAGALPRLPEGEGRARREKRHGHGRTPPHARQRCVKRVCSHPRHKAKGSLVECQHHERAPSSGGCAKSLIGPSAHLANWPMMFHGGKRSACTPHFFFFRLHMVIYTADSRCTTPSTSSWARAGETKGAGVVNVRSRELPCCVEAAAKT